MWIKYVKPCDYWLVTVDTQDYCILNTSCGYDINHIERELFNDLTYIESHKILGECLEVLLKWEMGVYD